jgi:hypothetical protein
VRVVLPKRTYVLPWAQFPVCGRRTRHRAGGVQHRPQSRAGCTSTPRRRRILVNRRLDRMSLNAFETSNSRYAFDEPRSFRGIGESASLLSTVIPAIPRDRMVGRRLVSGGMTSQSERVMQHLTEPPDAAPSASSRSGKTVANGRYWRGSLPGPSSATSAAKIVDSRVPSPHCPTPNVGGRDSASPNRFRSSAV